MNLTHQHTAMIDVATLAQNKTIQKRALSHQSYLIIFTQTSFEMACFLLQEGKLITNK